MNLTETEREELLSMRRSRTMAVGHVPRARLVLLCYEGASRGAIMNELRCDSRFITTWQTLFANERLAGLCGRHPGSAPRGGLARLEAKVLNYTLRRRPADDATHSSSRKLAAQSDVPSLTVQRIRCKHDIGRIVSIPTRCPTIPTSRRRLPT